MKPTIHTNKNSNYKSNSNRNFKSSAPKDTETAAPRWAQQHPTPKTAEYLKLAMTSFDAAKSSAEEVGLFVGNVWEEVRLDVAGLGVHAETTEMVKDLVGLSGVEGVGVMVRALVENRAGFLVLVGDKVGWSVFGVMLERLVVLSKEFEKEVVDLLMKIANMLLDFSRPDMIDFARNSYSSFEKTLLVMGGHVEPFQNEGLREVAKKIIKHYIDKINSPPPSRQEKNGDVQSLRTFMVRPIDPSYGPSKKSMYLDEGACIFIKVLVKTVVTLKFSDILGQLVKIFMDPDNPPPDLLKTMNNQKTSPFISEIIKGVGQFNPAQFFSIFKVFFANNLLSLSTRDWTVQIILDFLNSIPASHKQILGTVLSTLGPNFEKLSANKNFTVVVPVVRTVAEYNIEKYQQELLTYPPFNEPLPELANKLLNLKWDSKFQKPEFPYSVIGIQLLGSLFSFGKTAGTLVESFIGLPIQTLILFCNNNQGSSLFHKIFESSYILPYQKQNLIKKFKKHIHEIAMTSVGSRVIELFYKFSDLHVKEEILQELVPLCDQIAAKEYGEVFIKHIKLSTYVYSPENWQRSIEKEAKRQKLAKDILAPEKKKKKKRKHSEVEVDTHTQNVQEQPQITPQAPPEQQKKKKRKNK